MKIHHLFLVLLAVVIICINGMNRKVFVASGVKIGEVTANEAQLWVRLTREREPVLSELFPEIRYYDSIQEDWILDSNLSRKNREPKVTLLPGTGVKDLHYNSRGTSGWVRILYSCSTCSDQGEEMTEWLWLDEQENFIKTISLKGLHPNHIYSYTVQTKANKFAWHKMVFSGSFHTAPKEYSNQEIRFVATTCTSFKTIDSVDGNLAYLSMKGTNPMFFVHLGDNFYYDQEAKNLDLAQWHWNRTFSLPIHKSFFGNISSYFLKDDHDTWMNDSWKGLKTNYMGDFTFEQGQELFRKNTPIVSKESYRKFSWGKNLDIWLLDVRDYRDEEMVPFPTILGEKQLNWLENSLKSSKGSFKLIFIPTPIIGPDRANKNDNHSNKKFLQEGKRLKEILSQHKNLLIITGDRHWQYVSKDSEFDLYEVSVGPASDYHAGGWKVGDIRKEHLFLRVKGGFISGKVSEDELVIYHHDVQGEIMNSLVMDNKLK